MYQREDQRDGQQQQQRSQNYGSNPRGINSVLGNDLNEGNRPRGAGGLQGNYQGQQRYQQDRGFAGGRSQYYQPNGNGNSFGGQADGQRNNNRDQNYVPKQQFKPVLQIISEQALTEDFTDSCLCLVQSSRQQQPQQQQQIYQQVQQSYLDKVQIVFCNEQAMQIHSVEKSDQGMKLISSGCTSIQNNTFKIQKCFVLKNLLNNGQDASAFTIKSQQGYYGFTIITTDPQNSNQITSQVCQMVAHQQPITNIFLLQTSINSRNVNKIITVSNSNQDSNQDTFVKFWEFQQNGIILDQNSTIIFKDNLEQWFNSKNIKLDNINNLEFTAINNKQIVIMTFNKPRFEQFQPQQQQKQQAQANCAFVLELEFTQQRPIQGQKVEIGPPTSAIQKIEMVTNPKTSDYFLFAQLRNDTRNQQQQQPQQNNQPQGFLYAVKNLLQPQKVYENNFPLNDFSISFGTNQATIVTATTQSIQPITWNLSNDTYQPNKSDMSLKNQGDIQNIYLFKSIINLVEINQLLTVHYKGKNNPKKCITLSTLALLEHVERTDYGNRDNFKNKPYEPGNNKPPYEPSNHFKKF
ncbi:hypothetical protein ABPG72_000625 [Tetrahymena utriculariae]